jgi:hypothetical protein
MTGNTEARQLVGEFEALSQAVAYLNVGDVGLVTSKTFLQSLYSFNQGSEV